MRNVAGEVTLADDHSANVPAAVRADVEGKVRIAAAQLLLRTITQQGADARYLSALTVSEARSANVTVNYPVRSSGDLSTRK